MLLLVNIIELEAVLEDNLIEPLMQAWLPT